MTSENTVNVIGSVFEYLTSTSCGGAIFLTNDFISIFLTKCSFSYCSVPNNENCNGGAVYYSSEYKRGYRLSRKVYIK